MQDENAADDEDSLESGPGGESAANDEGSLESNSGDQAGVDGDGAGQAGVAEPPGGGGVEDQGAELAIYEKFYKKWAISKQSFKQ